MSENGRTPLLLTVLLVFVAASLAIGCKKKEMAAVAQDQQSDSNAAPPSLGRPPSIPVSAEPVVVADNGDVNATLRQLSLELRKYVVRTRSVPKTFEEFASKSQAQVPSPPAGKKYAIQNQAIVLVNR